MLLVRRIARSAERCVRGHTEQTWTRSVGLNRDPVTSITLGFNVMGTIRTRRPRRRHTHNRAPPRPVTKAPQQALGARWACPGHDTDSRATDAAARILCAEVPAPLIVLAVIMAATRQHPVTIWTAAFLSGEKTGLRWTTLDVLQHQR